MSWFAYTDGTRLRYVRSPQDEDLTGWAELALPVGFDPEGGPWVIAGESLVLDIEACKTQVRAQVKQKRDTIRDLGCMTAYGLIDSDMDSRLMISGAVQMALIGGAQFSVEWRMADNSYVTLDATQMTQIGLAVGQFVAACQAHKNVLDAEITSALTAEDLAAIDMETGWPT